MSTTKNSTPKKRTAAKRSKPKKIAVKQTAQTKAKPKTTTKSRAKKVKVKTASAPLVEADEPKTVEVHVQAEEAPSEVPATLEAEPRPDPTLEATITEKQKTDEVSPEAQQMAIEPTEDSAAEPKVDAPKEPESVDDTVKTVEIRITMPAFSGIMTPIRTRAATIVTRLKLRITRIRRRTVVLAGITVLLLFAGIVTYHIRSNHIAYEESHTEQGALGGNPTYTTILPAGKTITQLGGWTRVSPTNKNPAYAYADRIGGVGIVISEQPLPASMQSDPATQVGKVAQSFGTNQKVSAGNTTIYVITTSSSGPQSIVTTKNNVLLLMRSAAPVANVQWITYVDSLQ